MRLYLKTPEDQPVKFIELFFDIVFIFSVVQIVELLHGHFDLITVLESILIFWLVWWSWTQFTWVLNSADTENDFVEVVILVVTGISFVMAIAIPTAFDSGSLLFVGAYILTRVIGLSLYLIIARSYGEDLIRVVTKFSLTSIAGMGAALIGALLGGTGQYIMWSLVIIFDILSTLVSSREEGWTLQPEHFVERHGLFMIIVLGETLLINGIGLADAIENGGQLLLAVSSILVTLALWWLYFGHIKGELEESMVGTQPYNAGLIARDIYSLGHFPIIFGIIAYASALEEVILHPLDEISTETRIAFALGFLLYTSGIGLALIRANGTIIHSRFYIPITMGLIILLLPSITPVIILSTIFISILIIVVIEEKLFEN